MILTLVEASPEELLLKLAPSFYISKEVLSDHTADKQHIYFLGATAVSNKPGHRSSLANAISGIER